MALSSEQQLIIKKYMEDKVDDLMQFKLILPEVQKIIIFKLIDTSNNNPFTFLSELEKLLPSLNLDTKHPLCDEKLQINNKQELYELFQLYRGQSGVYRDELIAKGINFSDPDVLKTIKHFFASSVKEYKIEIPTLELPKVKEEQENILNATDNVSADNAAVKVVSASTSLQSHIANNLINFYLLYDRDDSSIKKNVAYLKLLLEASTSKPLNFITDEISKANYVVVIAAEKTRDKFNDDSSQLSIEYAQLLSLKLNNAVGTFSIAHDCNFSKALPAEILDNSICFKAAKYTEYKNIANNILELIDLANSNKNISIPRSKNNSALFDDALLYAVQQGDLDACRDLLSDPTDRERGFYFIDKENGANLLHLAAMHGHLPIMKLLVSLYPKLLNATTNIGYTALMQAAYYSYSDIFKFLLSVGANPDVVSQKGDSFYTLNMEDFVRNHQLIKSNFIVYKSSLVINPGQTENEAILINIYNATMLLDAAQTGDLEACKKIIETNPLVKENIMRIFDFRYEGNVLHWAANKGHLDVVKYLVSSLPTLLDTFSKNESTPLMNAVSGNHLSVTAYLLESGANAEIKNKEGSTAASIAENKGSLELRALLDKSTASKKRPLENANCNFTQSYKPYSKSPSSFFVIDPTIPSLKPFNTDQSTVKNNSALGSCFLLYNRYENNEPLQAFVKNLKQQLCKENVDITSLEIHHGESQEEICTLNCNAIPHANSIIIIGDKKSSSLLDSQLDHGYSKEVSSAVFKLSEASSVILPIAFDGDTKECLPFMSANQIAYAFENVNFSESAKSDDNIVFGDFKNLMPIILLSISLKQESNELNSPEKDFSLMR